MPPPPPIFKGEIMARKKNRDKEGMGSDEQHMIENMLETDRSLPEISKLTGRSIYYLNEYLRGAITTFLKADRNRANVEKAEEQIEGQETMTVESFPVALMSAGLIYRELGQHLHKTALLWDEKQVTAQIMFETLRENDIIKECKDKITLSSIAGALIKRFVVFEREAEADPVDPTE